MDRGYGFVVVVVRRVDGSSRLWRLFTDEVKSWNLPCCLKFPNLRIVIENPDLEPIEAEKKRRKTQNKNQDDGLSLSHPFFRRD
jgi:hypothetical protein